MSVMGRVHYGDNSRITYLCIILRPNESQAIKKNYYGHHRLNYRSINLYKYIKANLFNKDEMNIL